MTQTWNATAPGFYGNDNLYGIGIRVGYYTQAVSIWVANFYAKHEAPYLHTLTTLFLLALFIGLCVICINPKDNYAVEPFMLTSIAYYTLSTGLWDPSPPNLLRWEVEFRKQFTVMIIWLAFQGFDAWYWWVGVWKMKPSNGPLGTVIFYPYVGSTPLFASDEWISKAARTFNIIISIVLFYGVIRLCCFTRQQRRFDRFITVDRLKLLTTRWLQARAHRVAASGSVIVKDAQDPKARLATTSDEKKIYPTTSTKPGDVDEDAVSVGPGNPSSKGESSTGSQHDSECPPPYRRPTRTGTGLLKMGLWRRHSARDVDLSLPPPDYVLYEPTFEGVEAAMELLKAVTVSTEKKSSAVINFLKAWLILPRMLVEFSLYLYTQARSPWRPSILLAVSSHAFNKRFGTRMSYSKTLYLTLKHPTYITTNSKDVILASRIILLTNKPLKLSTGWYCGAGLLTLSVCSVLVISTELTIQWNGIKGVQDLSSVGQLIPFILGISGLLKVVYSALDRSNKEELCYYRHCAAQGKKGKWKAIADEVLECQKMSEQLGESSTYSKQKAVAKDPS